MRLNPIRTTMCAALICLAAWALSASAQNSGQAPTGRIAAVNLSQLFENLDEREHRERQIEQFIQEQNRQIEAVGNRLEAIQEDLNMLVEGTEARRRKAEEAVRARLDLEVQGRFSEQLIDRRRAEVFAELFEKIQTATAAYARRHGYDLILSNDWSNEIPRGQESQVINQMSNRRVLYSSSAIDVTSDITRQMNNEWAAGRQ